MQITILTSRPTPRLSYVLDWVIKERWGLSWTYKDHISDDASPTLCYDHDLKGELDIPRSGLLDQKEITPQDIPFNTIEDMPCLFYQNTESQHWQFDLFAMIFYLLSRYEEYLAHTPDKHGRYPSKASVASQHGFLRLPILDYWVEQLRQQLSRRYHIEIPINKEYTLLPTIDIDMPYAYRHRQIKGVAATMRDALLGRKKRVGQRLSYYRKGTDPFDTYHYLLEHLPTQSLFFFLMSNDHPLDENYLVNHPAYRDIIEKIRKRYSIGIHPSYASHADGSILRKEKERLESISGQPISISRQHYLKLSLAETYRNLLNAGITEDHSMMYADAVGFRAGTCHSFLWYDLERERVTDLRITSPCVMDVTMKDYESLPPTQSIEIISELQHQVKQYHGTFSFIWHNSSFSSVHGWFGWHRVFEYLVNKSPT